MSHWLSSSLALDINWFLTFDVIVKATLLLALASIVNGLLRRNSAALRHRIWTCAVIGALLMPTVVSGLPRLRIAILPAPADSATNSSAVERSQTSSATPAATFPARSVATPDASHPDAKGVPLEQSKPVGSLPTPVIQSTVATTSPWRVIRSQPTMLWIWLVGVLISVAPFMLAIVSHWLRAAQFQPIHDSDWQTAIEIVARQVGLARPPRSFAAHRDMVPAVFGVWRSYLVVPRNWRDWSDEHRTCILLHELAHIQRRDLATQFLGRLMATVYWFNPLAWYAVRRLRIERELACDDCVLQSGQRASDYARQLLLTLRMYRADRFEVGLAMGQSARLDDRVYAILDASRCRRPVSLQSSRAAQMLAAIITVSLGVATLVARPAQAQPAANQAVGDRPAATQAGKSKSAPMPAAPAPPQPKITIPQPSVPPAKQRGLDIHRQLASVDKLPRFFLRGQQKPRFDASLTKPAPDAITNLKRALDEVTVDPSSSSIEQVFAWDEKHVVAEMNSIASPQPAANESHMRWAFWMTRQLNGIRYGASNQPLQHSLAPDGIESWPNMVVINPGYLRAGVHSFWWGDNSETNQNFSSLPPSMATYRPLADEGFGGETCYVVESTTRTERLWISQQTGRLRGYLYSVYQGPFDNFHASEAVKNITGRTFSSREEYAAWGASSAPTAEMKLKLGVAWADSRDFSKSLPWIMVRFSDYREIGPGIWWPFHEEQVSGKEPGHAETVTLATFDVQELKTDLDLTQTVKGLQPKDGEKLSDQRHAIAIDYVYRADRSEGEVLKLVDQANQAVLNNSSYVNEGRGYYQALVGKPAPELPVVGWLGGKAPDLKGKPYLIHSWAAWSSNSQVDLPVLNKLAQEGATIIGLHPGLIAPSDVEQSIRDHKLTYPTLLGTTKPNTSLFGRTIAGYPGILLPYCVLVDANGKVADHGFLNEDEGRILKTFQSLRAAAP